jgi:hypothetical protein
MRAFAASPAEDQEMSDTSRLSEQEVRERLRLCEDSKIVDEVYSFGQTLRKEVVEQIRVQESKATYFAAYGAAIVTLLVSSSSTWSGLGNQWTLWIAFCAGACGLICTYFSVRVISPKKVECISEDEWLKSECFSQIDTLKRYRILTLWETIDSHDVAQREKATTLRRAQVWLTGSIVFLVYLLLHVAFLRTFSNKFWLALGQFGGGIRNYSGIQGWQSLFSSPGVLGGLICALILGLTFAFFIWHSLRL